MSIDCRKMLTIRRVRALALALFLFPSLFFAVSSNTVRLRRTWSLDVLNTVLLRFTPANVYLYLSVRPLGVSWWRCDRFSMFSMLFYCDTASRRWWLHEKKYCFIHRVSSRKITSFLIYVLQSSPTPTPRIVNSIFLFLIFSLPSVLLLRTSHSSRHAPFSLSLRTFTIFLHRPPILLFSIFRLSDDVRRRLSFRSLFFHLAVPLFLLLPAVPLRPGALGLTPSSPR